MSQSTDRPLRAWIAPALIVLTALLVYGCTLDIPFYLDDQWNLLSNPSVRNWRDMFSVLAPPVGADEINLARRPFINLTFAFNYALDGYAPAGYHAFNIAVHILNGLLLYALLRRVLRGPGQDSELVRAAPILSALAALLWVAHPLNTAAVNYVNQRTELLTAFFTLATLYALHRSTTSSRPLAWKALGVGACGLGMACKEVMAVVPVLALVYDRIFLAGSWRDVFRRRKGFYAALFGTWGLLGVFLLRFSGATGGLLWRPYLLTQAWALNRYIKLAFWPHPLVFDYGVVLIHDLAAVWSAGLAVLVLIALSVALLFKAPGMGFLGLAFFLILAPTSSVNPVIGQTVAEHRMYLPLIPLIVAVLLAGWWFTRADRKLQRGVALALLLLVPVYGMAARRRNEVYRDPIRLWTDTIAAWPENDRAHNNLGTLLMKAGRIREGLAALEASVRLNPRNAKAWYNLGLTQYYVGRQEDAVSSYRQALALRPDAAAALGNMARALLSLGRADEAGPAAQRAAQLRPDDYRLFLLLGDIAYRAGRQDEAVQLIETAANLARQKGQPGPVLEMLSSRAQSYRNREPFEVVHPPGRIRVDEVILDHHDMAR
ncbi:MAG: tetratricopeptide repeat protein [Kiritimatiellae bacterium]|nr:tetratricopeptide repeat protein [Kiritimatiellia bacterium]